MLATSDVLDHYPSVHFSMDKNVLDKSIIISSEKESEKTDISDQSKRAKHAFKELDLLTEKHLKLAPIENIMSPGSSKNNYFFRYLHYY